MQGGFKEFTVTIVINTKPSTAFEVARAKCGSWQLPGAITASNFGVQFSVDGVTWTDAETAFAGAANATYEIPAKAFSGRYARLYSATNQLAARTIRVVLKQLIR